MKWTKLAVAAVVTLLATAASPWPLHEGISLNGEWEYQKVAELLPMPTAGWQTTTVPGYLSGWDYEKAWLRKTVRVPDDWRGQRVKLHFNGSKFLTIVYVNGAKVGENLGGYEAFEFDITDQVRVGRDNELMVAVHDWTATFTKPVDLSGAATGIRLRSVPRDAIITPIGGLHQLYGIWDDVSMYAVPPVHISGVFVKPSVRKKRLAVEVTLANESRSDASLALSSVALDGEQPALDLHAKNARVAAGETARIVIEKPWPDPHMWAPWDPYLYTLGVRLLDESGNEADAVKTRFGFRELWAEGPDFYLNGKKTVLRATSWWPPHAPETREQIRETMEQIKAGNSICFRTHTQPWREVWYDVADEVGLMMIPEGAVWNDDTAYRVNDPLFWENYATHLRRTVANLRNHPSIVIWSLENEMYGSALNDKTPCKESLFELGRKMKRYDPTRLMTYESDGDPGGVADVIGIHYPHEYPQFNLYPNTCYWMDEPISMGHAFTNGTGKWKWNRKKPVYIGEFLWIPSSDPSWHTIFLGDDAYLDYRNARMTAKAMSWRMQIEAYRWYGVSGISPWTLIEGGPPGPGNILWEAQKGAYEPNAAFIKEYDSRFYAGDKVRRTIVLYNDTPEDADLEVRLMWPSSELVGQRLITESSANARLAAGEKKTLTMDLTAPENVTRREDLPCNLDVLRDGKSAYAAQKAYSFFPEPKLSAPNGLRIGLFDRAGATRKLFDQYGVAAKNVDSLDDLDNLDVLIVGANTLRQRKRAMPVVGGEASAGAKLREFIAKGGRALILAQKNYPAHLTITAPTSHASTIAFPQMPAHPILRDVRKEDLRWWRGDNLVSQNDLERPRTGGCLPIVVSGSRAGIAFCPLMEIRDGAGTMVLCQLKLVEKFGSEPMASLILNNVLSYLRGYAPPSGRTAVISPSNALKQCLRDINLRFDDLTGKLSETDLSAYRVLIAEEATDELLASGAKVRRFVEGGGRALLHRLTPEELDSLRDLMQCALTLQPSHSPIVRNRGDDALLAYLTNEDLYWLGKHAGIGWSTTPRATGMADFTFGKSLEGAQTVGRYDARDMELRGHIVLKQEDGVVCATVGTVAAQVEFPQSGTYIFELALRGTPAGDVWPNAEVRVDGDMVGVVAAGSREWQTYSVFGDVAAGAHEVTISFTNDANIAGEDRNLYVQSLTVARDTSPKTDSVLLTQPPASVKLPRGKGFFVIDEINWDTEERNAVKASRYACSLLTGMGAQFGLSVGTYIEAEDLKPQPGMAHFRRDDTSAYLGSSGYIAGPFRCEKAGRYVFKVVARGTKAADAYPIVEVRIDDEPVGSVELQSDGWRGYSLPVELSKGPHEIKLAFTNDFYEPPEDRNLQLDRVEVYEAE